MNSEYKGVLSALGYNTESKGAILFMDLLNEVRNLLNEEKTEEEIRKLLPRYYLEDYHFCYEIPKNIYFEELKAFCNSRVITDENKSINSEIMGDFPNSGLEESLLFFATKFNEFDKTKRTSKIIVKTSRVAEIIGKV